MSIEVTWEIISVDETTGDVVVKFTNGTKENTVAYKWEGDKDALIKRLNDDAYAYTHAWMCAEMTSGIKTELFGMTGTVSSNDTINLDNKVLTFLNPEVI